MRVLPRRALLALLAAVPLAWGATAPAQGPATNQLVVTYVEAPAAQATAVERTLADYAADLARRRDAPGVEMLREVGRPQRMAVIERWPEGAVPADGAVAALLDGRLQAPVDRRVHKATGPLLPRAASAPFHMLMHVDVVPAGAATAAQLLDAHRAAVMAAPGARGFEFATQPDRPNHFAVHETWASRAAYEAYAAGPAARELRRQLAPFKGALFDDRFYAPVTLPVRR